MRTEDQVIETFDMRMIRTLIPEGAPIIMIYEDPADYPGQFVARLYNGRQATHLVALADTLEELREAKPAQMARINRTKTDPPKIVETWL